MLLIKTLLKTKGATEAALKALADFYHGKIAKANQGQLQVDADYDTDLETAEQAKIDLEALAVRSRITARKQAQSRRKIKTDRYDKAVSVLLGKQRAIDAALS